LVQVEPFQIQVLSSGENLVIPANMTTVPVAAS
jgi:transposase